MKNWRVGFLSLKLASEAMPQQSSDVASLFIIIKARFENVKM